VYILQPKVTKSGHYLELHEGSCRQKYYGWYYWLCLLFPFSQWLVENFGKTLWRTASLVRHCLGWDIEK